MHCGATHEPELERWLERALTAKRRERRTGSSPYDIVPAGLQEKAAKRHRRVSLKASRHHSPHQWKGHAPSATRFPSPGRPGTPPQHNSLPNITEPAPIPPQGPVVDTPPEKRRRGERNASSQGERGCPQEQVAAVDTPVKAARLSPGRKAQKKEVVGEAEERMSAADLAAKKMLLPFINELSFIEIALAARGNPSGGGLASSNPIAKDAINLFQSSYLFTEGLSSLGKATGTIPRNRSPRRSPRKTQASAAGPPATSGTTPRPRVGPAICESPLGKRGRGCSDDDGSSIASNNQESTTPGGGGKHQHGEVRGPSQQPPMVTSSVLNSSCKAQLPRVPGATSPVILNGGNHGGGVSVASSEKSGGSRCSLGNPDVARVLRKYPQFCDFVGLTLQAVRLEGLAPRYHPPAWTFGLCEAVLDECWKSDAQTGAGGTRALRNTRRAAAGMEARLAACTTEVDKWCLAQAKDLEIREEGERDDNCEERKKRKQRRRRQNLRQETPTDGGGTTKPGEATSEAASSLRLPEFVATFLWERFGVRAVALQAAVDLLFGLETLRPSFPEVEHFSLLLRELHDMGALALALHAREVVSRLGGLRLRDVKRRLAQPDSRHPLRNEVVVSPHPALPMAVAQVWLTRKGGIAVAFLLLGGGSRGVSRSKIAGIVKDARHVVSSTRAAWGRSPEEATRQQKIPSVPSKRTLMEQTGSTTESGANVENGNPAESTKADRGHIAESGSCMDLKLRNTAHGSIGAPYIPLHGLLFCLCELHMKTPEEILEKSKSADNGGGLGMLATLARAVEQEDRREELSMQLAEETRNLDVLGAEVLRLEGRTRALEDAAAVAAAAGYEGEAQGGASVIDGLSKARVALALKSAAARRQRDTVKTMTSEVRLADVQVAASWHDVMSPLPPPSNGEAVNSTEAPIFSGGSTVSSASTTATGVAGRIATSTNAPGGVIRRRNDNGEDSLAAEKAGEMMRFQIEAGDGLSKADAADLTFILRKSVIDLGENSNRSVSNRSSSNISSKTSSGDISIHSSSARGLSSSGLVSSSRPSSSSWLSHCGGGSVAVPGSTPLEVKPGLAARKALRTLRMYVTRLRVTKDNEAKAEEIDWKEKLEEHRLAATVVIQRWARRVRHDTTMIFLAKQKANILRYARDKARRHALAEEERQVFAAREVLKRQQMRIIEEQEAVETILKDAMIREADQRYWRARIKTQTPILRAWRVQVKVEVRFRSHRRGRLCGVLADWRAWIAEDRKRLAAVAKIQQAWFEYRRRCQMRLAIMALTKRHERIRLYMIQALGRNASDRFARWKLYTNFMNKVKLMGGVHVRQGLQQRLNRWKAFTRSAKDERLVAATRLQALARAMKAKKTTKALRRERWARTMIGRQLTVQIAIIRFGKWKRRMARLRVEVAAFRKGKDDAFFVRVLREWQGDAHGRAVVRRSIVGMERKRDERVRRAAISAWRETAAGIAQNRRRKEQTAEERAAERSRAATLIQATWRSHSTRKAFKHLLREWRAAVIIQKRWRGFQTRSTTTTKAGLDNGVIALQRLFRGHQARSRYLTFFVSEAGRAASTGRYERLFWLADRWPALTQHEVFAAMLEGGGGGEGLLHLACRATAHRCVELCLQREANVHAVTPAGLTPLHCLALYQAPPRGDRAHHGYGESITAMDDYDRNSEDDYSGSPNRRSQTSTAVVAVPPTTTPAPSSPNSAISATTGQRGLGITLPDGRSVAAQQQQQQQQRQQERQYHQQQRKLSADRSARTIADMLLDAGANPDAVDGDGNTPLLTAAKTGAAVLCEILLARGADPRARNNSGSNALLLAVDGDNSAENSACAQVLLDAGSDPHETRPDGTVALHVSAQKGQTEVLWSLLQHGAHVDVADVSGLTPLAYAVSNDHGNATGLLCDYGADLDLADAAGRTALHVASQDGKVNALAELLGRSVNVDAKDAMGETALHYAAYSGKVEAVRALLETGADPSLQNLRGDNAAHIASRAGYVEIVRALVEYDVRIGQRNWQEYTPFGEARMNNHSQVAEFLSGSFVRLGGKGPSSGGNNGASTPIAELDDAQQQQQGGNEARRWDKEMEDKVRGWETEWDQDKQRFCYVNAETGETSYTAPFKISADRVEELREGAEVEYLRKVAPVNGESLLGLSDYREAFQEEKTELDTHKLRHQAAVVIQSCWRARMARIEANRRRKERRCASVIKRQMRRFLGRCRRKRLGQVTSACLMLQNIVRGCLARRRHHEGEAEMKRLRDANTLNRLVTRVYRGHLYGRRPARKLRAQLEASWWGPSEWEAAWHDAGDPLRTFYGWTGQWEAYLLQGSVDVMFYRNAASAEYTWDLPEEWQSHDAFDFYQREHARIHGFTAEEAEAAKLLQKAWRGKTSRNHFNLLMRAQKICKGAEAAYLADPDNLRSQINYILFTHVIDKDYNRSRILYTTALASMEQRGPDLQLLLFAFAIFCFVTREEDFVSILATVERAIEAGAAMDDADGFGRRWPPESYTSRRNPKRFALAEAGFFRFAAYNINDAESWHNYAACRQLAYGDYAGASECYLKAIEKNPKDPKLQANYQTLMDTFPEHSQGSSTFESLNTHHQLQAEHDKRRQDTASAKFLQRPEVKQAVLKIERAYLRSRQRQIDRFGTYLGPTGMLLREVQGEALVHQRQHTASSPGSNNRGRQHDQRQQSAPPLHALLSNSSSPGREHRGPLLLLPRAAGSALSGDDGRSQGSSASARVHQGVEGPYMTSSCTFRKESGPMAPALSGPSFDDPSRSPGLAPPGWDIAEDDAGNTYYFNGETGESCWDPRKPRSTRSSFDGSGARTVSVSSAAGGVSAGDLGATPGDTTAAAAGRDFSAQAAAAGDAAHGQLSGGETVHTRRYSEAAESGHGTEKEEGEELPAFPAGDAENATTDAGLAEYVGGSEPHLPLPDGWEAVDVGDGSIYYHHVLSGLTQWEVPREDEPHEITTAMAATPPDGSPWEEFKTEEGVPFWYNSSTGESSWSSPGHPADR